MSDQIHPAPRAPQLIATQAPAPAPTPTAEAHNFSRPGTAHTVSPSVANTAPATGATPTAFPPTTPHNATTTEEPQTLNEKLNVADRYWKFKTALQTIAILIALIGIGTIGWCVSTMGHGNNSGYGYGYNEFWTLWPTLITFSISIVWCTACILVFVVRKRHVHPGARVAMDLMLWLGFIITALFAMVGLLELLSWGEYGSIGDSFYSSYGDYVLADNGTWIWERDSDYTTYTRECNRTSSASSYYFNSGFHNCEEQDAYVNQLWREKPHRYSVELTGVVCQFFGLVLHFALFVWACVDCNRYNRSKVSKDAEKIAAGIVQTMITNGAVIPPPGQAHMRPTWGQPQMGYYQLPPQQIYPMVTIYPQQMAPGQHAPQQYRGPHPPGGPAASPVAGPVADSSNEKSEGPRYA